MPTARRPRRGSLQFYPRKRASKLLPSVNWNAVTADKKESGILGFIAYKVGMATAVIKDNGDKSMTKGKNLYTPVTILEAPNMKIFSVRFFKNKRVIKDLIVSHDKELKRKLRVPKQLKKLDESVPADFDDVHVIVYSLVHQTSVKKTPDMIELDVNAANKLDFVKNLIGKELSISDFIKASLLDVRSLTTGKGTQGPIKRFGAKLRFHKSEKGVRKIGSIAPWHPNRVTFRSPMAGQMGLFTRVTYNLMSLFVGKISDKDINPKSGFRHYGKIKSSYIIVKGSVPGPQKRQILITPASRPSKYQMKKKLEFVEVLTQ